MTGRMVRRNNREKIMIKIILIAGFVYAVVVLILSMMQRQFLYNPSTEHPLPEQWDLASMTVVHYRTQDQVPLYAWYQAAAADKPTVVYFHGNTGHLGDRAHRVKPLLDAGYGMLLTSYRGYSGNPGNPSEQGLYQDARAAIHYLTKQEKLPLRCLALYGESLGSGVAVQMATEFPISGLVLISPYTSIMEVASMHYPWAPTHFILRDRFNSIAKIKHIHVPIYIAHGTTDHVVPTKLGQRLFTKANSPKELKLFEGIGHNNFPAELSTEVNSFLAKLPGCHPI